MSRKAQLSMDTIMIYGAVILVVTLAIGALIYFGVLDLGAMLPDKCDSGGKITCENFVVDTTNGVKLEFINRVGKNIDVTAIKITGLDDWTGTDSTGSYTGSGISNGERFLADALAVTLTGKKGYSRRDYGNQASSSSASIVVLRRFLSDPESDREMTMSMASMPSSAHQVISSPVVS